MLNERKLTKPELAKREDIVMDMKKNKRKLVKKYGKDAEKVMYGRATNMAKKQTENMDDKKLNLRKMIEDALQNPKKSIVKEWGSSDQSIMNQSIHRDLGEPKEFPGLSQIMSAAEDAVDFYWDDWDEYQTDRDGLIMSAAQRYARQYHPGFMAMASKMMEPIDEKKSVVTEDKSEAAYELQEIMDQLYELSDRAKQIIRSEFPSEYSRLDAYGALDFGTSLNSYDITFEKTLEDLKMYQDNDMDMMQEDLDLGHQDDEPGMLKGDLYKIGKYSMELYQMMDSLEGMGEVDLPHWWQSKITTAKNMISGAKHYLDFEMKEPQIDAMVNVAAEEDVINEAAGKFVVRPCTAKDTPWAVWQTSEGGENDKRIEGFKTKEDAQKFADEKNSMNEIGMFLDPIGYEKTAPKKEIFTKKYVSPGVYDIFKNGKKVKTIKGEGEANAWMNQARREMNEGMSEEEWAEATEKANLSKLKDSDQDKIKKIVAMLKAEKKPKK